MRGAVSLGGYIASVLNVTTQVVGFRVPVVEGGWSVQLEAARPNLNLLAQSLDAQLDEQQKPIVFMGRCAASIATLPLVAQRAPDAAIVWFDAHGDCNVPVDGCTTEMNYLGGMVITGAAGEWSTGFGCGVDLANVILVGSRDLDPPELERIEAGQIRLVPVGPNLGQRLADAIAGRRVYVHLDCDVLDAGLIATEYQCPGGLSFRDLGDAFAQLARHEVLGLEITEYEDCWPNGDSNDPEPLRRAIEPLLMVLRAG